MWPHTSSSSLHKYTQSNAVTTAFPCKTHPHNLREIEPLPRWTQIFRFYETGETVKCFKKKNSSTESFFFWSIATLKWGDGYQCFVHFSQCFIQKFWRNSVISRVILSWALFQSLLMRVSGIFQRSKMSFMIKHTIPMQGYKDMINRVMNTYTSSSFESNCFSFYWPHHLQRVRFYVRI